MLTCVERTIKTEQEMLAAGGELAVAFERVYSLSPTNASIALFGDLGAGKTTFVRGFLRHLGYIAAVKSPTYTLVESYLIGNYRFNHFDLYRLRDARELEFIGIADYFSGIVLNFIEWAERGKGILPLEDLSCFIDIQGCERTIKMKAQTCWGDKWVRLGSWS